MDRMRERARFESWMDSLSLDERAVADRLVAMPGGNHAVAWLGVEFTRNQTDTHRQLAEFRALLGAIKTNTDGGKNMSGISYATIGGIAVALLAAVGKMLGVA